MDYHKLNFLRKNLIMLFNSLGYMEILTLFNIKKSPTLESFTINKEIIYLNLKIKNIKYLYLILIHEIAHILCDEIGHTKKFHSIFLILCERSKQLNIL